MSNGTHRNVSTNGVRPETAPLGDRELDLLWDSLPPRVTKELEQPLDLALVSSRRGRANRTYPYLEGHVAIAQANRVFGHGGWGYEVVGEIKLREVQAVDPKTGEVRTSHAYAATVRVDVPGVPSPHRRGVPRREQRHGGGPRDRIQGSGNRRPEEGAPKFRRPVRERPLRRPCKGGRRERGSGQQPWQGTG